MSDRPMPPLLIAAMANARAEVGVVMILTTATGYYTYLGASAIEPSGDWMTKAGCALFAISVSAGLYLLWRAVLSAVPMLPHRSRWLAIPIVAVVIVFAAGVSTYFNLTGMIGQEAVRYHTEASLEGLSDATAKAANQAQEGLEGASAIRLNQAKFQQMADAERTAGRTTGGVGSGAITGMLEQVATVMAAAARDADAKTALAKTLAGEAENSLSVMRGIVNDPALPLQAMTARFATEAESLRLKLLQLSRLEIASTVRQAIAAARETVKPALSSNQALAERQKKVIQDLTQLLNELDSLGQVGRQAAPIPMLGKPVQSITVYTAVWLHWPDYIPAALACLFIDILFVPVLALKCLVQSALNDHGRSDTAKRYVVAELLEMRELMEKLGLAVPVRQVVRAEVMPPAEPVNARDRTPVFRTIPSRFN